MGRRGPRPTPTAKLRLVGSRAVEKRRGEPTPDVAAPNPPSWLAAEAKAEWRRVVPELVALGVIARIDRAALAAYCEAWAQYVAAVKALGKSGWTFTTAKGYVCQHPNAAILNTARAAVLRFAQELGLSPSARARVVGLPKRGADDALGEFVAKRGRNGTD